MVIIGDLHQKNEKTQNNIKYLFDWVEKTFDIKNEILILLGDVCDKSIMPNFNLDFFIKIFKKFKKVFVLKGNHDWSKNNGYYLSPLNFFDNITTITEITELEIEGLNCLFLPHSYDPTIYDNLEDKNYDYIFCHAYFKENNYDPRESINIDYLLGIKLSGHDHEHKILSNNKIVVGSPIVTRKNEELYDKHVIMQINGKNNYKLIDTPKIFTYHNIDHGEEVKCDYPYFELYIHNAPSNRLAKKMYKNYDIYKVLVKSDLYQGGSLEEIEKNVDEKGFNKKVSLIEYFEEFIKIKPKSVGVVDIIKKLLNKKEK